MAQDVKLMKCTVLGDSQVGKASVISLLCDSKAAYKELDETAIVHCTVAEDGTQHLVSPSEYPSDAGTSTSIIQYISPRKRVPLHNVFLAKFASPGICLVVFKLTKDSVEDSALKSVKPFVYDVNSCDHCRVFLVGTHKGLSKEKICTTSEYLQKSLPRGSLDTCKQEKLLFWAIDIDSNSNSDTLRLLRSKLQERMAAFNVSVSVAKFITFRDDLKSGESVLGLTDDRFGLYRHENVIINPKKLCDVLSTADEELSSGDKEIDIYRCTTNHLGEDHLFIGALLHNCGVAVRIPRPPDSWHYVILGDGDHVDSEIKGKTAKPLYLACRDDTCETYYVPSTLFITFVNVLQQSGWKLEMKSSHNVTLSKTEEGAGITLHITHQKHGAHEKIKIDVVKLYTNLYSGEDPKARFVAFSKLCRDIRDLIEKELASFCSMIGFACNSSTPCTGIAVFQDGSREFCLTCPKKCHCPGLTWGERLWYHVVVGGIHTPFWSVLCFE